DTEMYHCPIDYTTLGVQIILRSCHYLDSTLSTSSFCLYLAFIVLPSTFQHRKITEPNLSSATISLVLGMLIDEMSALF
ncbi:21705_t:CDS:1, partial [Entrophospora sp. SA101]